MATRPEVTGRKSGRRLLDYQALRERGIPWSRIHVGRLEAAGKFPLHIDLGENSIAWFEDEIDDHLEKKAAERDAKVAERAAKAQALVADTECRRQFPGEAQGASAIASGSAVPAVKSRSLLPRRPD
jgi:prophage regulatory protein